MEEDNYLKDLEQEEAQLFKVNIWMLNKILNS